MFKKLRPKRESHGSGTHWHAGMTGVRVLDRIGRQYPDGINTQIFQFSIELRIHICLRGRPSGATPQEVPCFVRSVRASNKDAASVTATYNCNRGAIKIPPPSHVLGG